MHLLMHHTHIYIYVISVYTVDVNDRLNRKHVIEYHIK